MFNDPKLVQALFLRLVELAPTEREAALDRECGSNAELRLRVAALLEAHDELDCDPDRPWAEFADAGLDADEGGADSAVAGEPLPGAGEGGVAGIPQGATADYRPAVYAGAEISGRYKLLRRLGQGGMGEVWVASQSEPVKRKVALKLIKTGMDSRAVLARFEQERQALAMMDHPHIARVFDGGMTPTGRPYFVMELVNGLPLTTFCDRAKLTLRERLELFVPICRAVQHAHQKGVVHRDLKPANILVTLIDDKPVPKVIDFGVAKAVAGRVTDESIFTLFGAVVGTLEYMSPEQALFSGIDIDTRSDVYTLGVILYELLTGNPPLDRERLRHAALDEILRMIREEEPPKPSTKVSTDASLPSIAASRQIEPQKLASFLRGDLDWILMKAIDKARDRRYDTALGLAQDVERYLHNQPVLAVPPSRMYLFRKYATRNRNLLATLGLILIVLVAAALVSSSLAVSLGRAVHRARAALERSEKLASRNRQLAARETAALAKAVEERDETKRQLSRAEANQLAARSREVMEKNAKLSLQLAIESVETTRRARTEATRASRQILRDLLARRGSYLWETEVRSIHSLATSRDGHWLAVGAHDGVIKIRHCDPHLNDVITLQDHESQVTELAFSPDGRWLASAGGNRYGGPADTRVRLWDLADLQAPPRILGEHIDNVNQLTFSPDGRWLVSGGTRQVKVWDMADDRTTDQRLVLESSSTVNRFSVDGRWWLGMGKWWDLTRDDPFAEPATPSDDVVRAMFLPTNGSALVEMSLKQGKVSFLDPKSFAETESFELAGSEDVFKQSTTTGGRISLSHCEVSPDAKRAVLITGPQYLKTSDAEIWVWSLEPGTAGQPPMLLTGHSGQVASMAISPDGRWLVTTGMQDSLAIAWDLQSDQPSETALTLVNSGPSEARFSNDGDWLLTWSGDSVRFWPMLDDGPGYAIAPRVVKPNEDFRDLPTYPYTLRAFLASRPQFNGPPQVMSRSGRFQVTGNEDRAARVWDMSAIDENRTAVMLNGLERKIQHVAVSRSERWVACSTDRTTRIWDLLDKEPGTRSVELTGHGALRELRFHPNDTCLIGVSAWVGKVLLWPMPVVENTEPILLEINAGPNVFDVDQAGQWAVLAGGKSARIWNLEKPDPPQDPVELPVQDGTIGIVSVSGDGHWLLTAGSHGARIWDLHHAKPEETGIELTRARGVQCAAFSPDARFLAIAMDKDAFIYDMATDDPPRSVQRLGTRQQHLVHVKFSPDGNWLALGDMLQTIQLWKRHSDGWLATSTVLERSSPINFVEFSPDGLWLATSSGHEFQRRKNTVNLWWLENDGRLKDPITVGDSKLPLIDAVFSSDGRWLSVIDVAGTLRVWPNRLDDLVELALKRAGGESYRHPQVSPAATQLAKRGWAHEVDSAGHVHSATVPAGAELARLAAVEGFDLVQHLVVEGESSEEDLHVICELEQLRSLSMNRLVIADGALEVLNRLKGLSSLSLNASHGGDLEFADLRDMTELRRLALRGARITDRGWRQVASLPELRSLSVSGGRISHEAIRQLARHPRLVTLELEDMGVDDRSLEHFRGNNVLQELALQGSDITDEGLPSLNGMRFRTLKLSHCPISGEGLARLTDMPALNYVYVDGTSVTKKDAEMFERQHPGCRVLGAAR